MLLISRPAWCGLFFEPYVGSEIGGGKYETQPTATLPSRDFKLQGSHIGFRFGAKVASFWIGLEPRYSQGTIQSDYPALSTSSNESFSLTTVHGLIGYDLPKALRIWIGVGVFDTQKEVVTSSENAITSNSYKVGLGFRWQRLGLNLEYASESPTKIKNSISGDININTEYSKIAMNRSSASLSWTF